MWDASGKKKNYCWHCEHILTTNKDLLRMAYQRVTTFIHILRQVWQFRTGLFAPSVLEVKGEDLRHHVWFARVVTSLPLGFSASFPQTPINNALTMVLFKISG